MSTTASSQTASICIRRVRVEKLFGQFNYDFTVPQPDSTKPANLLILYGENGSGKTTLLKLVFELLSLGRRRRAEEFIAKTVFKSFEVELEHGIRVEARRTSETLVGPYVVLLYRGKELSQRIDSLGVESEDDEASPMPRGRRLQLAELSSKIRVELHLLSDDRRITSSLEPEDTSDEARLAHHAAIRRRRMLARRYRETVWQTSESPKAPSREQILGEAVEKISDWVKEQVLRRSRTADEDTNTVYTDVIRRIAEVRAGEQDQELVQTEELINGLLEQEKRSRAYSGFGIIRPINVQPIVDSLKTATDPTSKTIGHVLRPYVDGLKKRLDALEEVYKSIAAFVGIINSFYTGKKTSFTVRDGIRISSSGSDLSLRALSSGEKQLLLLFSNVLIARNRNSIFMIDEPEISLNVKWQRKLVNTLLDFTPSGRVQFLLATHSVELLTSHQDHVVSLHSDSDVTGDFCTRWNEREST